MSYVFGPTPPNVIRLCRCYGGQGTGHEVRFFLKDIEVSGVSCHLKDCHRCVPIISLYRLSIIMMVLQSGDSMY